MPVDLLVGAVVGAALTSSKVRSACRRGVVYGLAGGLIAYDKVSALASGAVRSARNTVASASSASAPEGTQAAGQVQSAAEQPASRAAAPSS